MFVDVPIKCNYCKRTIGIIILNDNIVDNVNGKSITQIKHRDTIFPFFCNEYCKRKYDEENNENW